MSQLIQLVYASRSAFVVSKDFKGIDPTVGRILLQSRKNNKPLGLVGVLYFGEGSFFQCLEGEVDSVDALYQKILVDPRHQELKKLSRKDVDQRSFANWDMKFVPLEEAMGRLLKARGHQSFDPHSFDASMVESVLALLQEATVAP